MGDGNLSQEDIDALLMGGDASTDADPLAGLTGDAPATESTDDLLAGLTGGDDSGMMFGGSGSGDDMSSLDALAGLGGADTGAGGIDLGFGGSIDTESPGTTSSAAVGGGYFGPKPPNYDLLLNVELLITVELGRVKKYVKDILALGEGSIIELDKTASDPVDLLISNKIIGHGEVVVSDENFGVRITKWNKLG